MFGFFQLKMCYFLFGELEAPYLILLDFGLVLHGRHCLQENLHLNLSSLSTP